MELGRASQGEHGQRQCDAYCWCQPRRRRQRPCQLPVRVVKEERQPCDDRHETGPESGAEVCRGLERPGKYPQRRRHTDAGQAAG
jgi:hypothetical protein